MGRTPLFSLAAGAILAIAAGGGATLPQSPAARQQGPAITVYKSPSCGCCARWVDHVRAAGFTVTARDTNDVEAVKDRHGVPPALASCHTAVADGYVFEGHIPADLIARFLREKPAAAGLAVPGMPLGSPGMEGAGAERYDVLIFDRQGGTRVYATR